MRADSTEEAIRPYASAHAHLPDWIGERYDRRRVTRFVVVWLIPIGLLVTAVGLYVYVEDRIFFYDPRGFQLVAISLSSSARSGPTEFIGLIQSMARSEYPPYWALPLVILPPELLNHRSIYILSMTLLGLVPTVVLLARVAARVLCIEVRMSTVLIAALNPVTFLICVQGVPDLIGFAFILGSIWVLVSRSTTRRSHFWALVLGAVAALVKKNFLFDLGLICALFLASYVIVAVRNRRVRESLGFLTREVISARFISGVVISIVLVQLLTPGTVSAIFGRDNSLFYASYKEPLATVLAENMSYAGGVVGMIAVVLAVLVVGRIITRGSPIDQVSALTVLGFVVASEIVWAIVQSQPGLIHQIHAWPLALTLGFVGAATLFSPRYHRRIEAVAVIVALVQFAYMFAPATSFTDSIRTPVNSWPLILQLRVSAPLVQTNIEQLIEMARVAQLESDKGGPILVPIGSNALNSNILSEVFSQRMSTASPDIYAMPQVDLQDALPWSTLVGDDGRVVLVSTSWKPAPTDGRRNLLDVDEFLRSDAAQRWVLGSVPLEAGVDGQLEDLTLIRLRIPETDALLFAQSIRDFLPSSDLGVESQLALLTDGGRRMAGPSSQTPAGWTTIAGANAPTRVLVNGIETVHFTPSGGDCTGLQYSWQDISRTESPTIYAGVLASGGGDVSVPQQVDGPWSFVLTFGLGGKPVEDCAVTLSTD